MRFRQADSLGSSSSSNIYTASPMRHQYHKRFFQSPRKASLSPHHTDTQPKAKNDRTRHDSFSYPRPPSPVQWTRLYIFCISRVAEGYKLYPNVKTQNSTSSHNTIKPNNTSLPTILPHPLDKSVTLCYIIIIIIIRVYPYNPQHFLFFSPKRCCCRWEGI